MKNKVKVVGKYQIVIPKDARKALKGSAPIVDRGHQTIESIR